MEEGRGQDGHLVSGQLRRSGGTRFQWRSLVGVTDGPDSAKVLLGFGGDSLESPTSFHFSVAPAGISQRQASNGVSVFLAGSYFVFLFHFFYWV